MVQLLWLYHSVWEAQWVLLGYNYQAGSYIPVITGSYNPVVGSYTPVVCSYTPVVRSYTPVVRSYTPVVCSYTPVVRSYTRSYTPVTKNSKHHNQLLKNV